MPDPLLLVDSVSKSFRENNEKSLQVLSDVSFSLEEGRLCAVCGPSGAGKTTLLNIVAGYDSPDHGEVYFGGKRLDSLGEEKRAKLRTSEMGIVFQSANLISHLTALENVLVPTLFLEAKLHRGEKSRAVALLKEMKLEEKMGKTPSALSDGEKRRVSIARALVTKPKLILADEPTINLDSENRDNVLSLFRRFANEGGSAFMATHDDEVARSADDMLKIRFGKVSS